LSDVFRKRNMMHTLCVMFGFAEWCAFGRVWNTLHHFTA